MIRLPAVAGQFYPGDTKNLSGLVGRFIGHEQAECQNAIAVISPHAGYIYSGMVAGETLGKIRIPSSVVMLGPTHRPMRSVAALSQAKWQTPLADTGVDVEIAQMLLDASPHFAVDESAHRLEHSLEVQLPFLQALQKNLAIVPILLSYVPFAICEELGNALAKCIGARGESVLILASTDMTHYESRANAQMKDRRALDLITQLEPAQLYSYVVNQRISMCGVIPVVVSLIAAKLLGAMKAEVVRYTDSGEVSGDTAQVVGYAGVIIS